MPAPRVDIREFLEWKRENWPRAKSKEEDEKQLGEALKAYSAKLRRDMNAGSKDTSIKLSKHKPFKIQSSHDHRRSREARDGDCQAIASKLWATRSSALQTRNGHTNINAPSLQQHYITASRDAPAGNQEQTAGDAAMQAEKNLEKRLQIMLQLKQAAAGEGANSSMLKAAAGLHNSNKKVIDNQVLSVENHVGNSTTSDSGSNGSRRPSSASMFAKSFKQAMGQATKVAHKAGNVASKLLHKKPASDLYDHSCAYEDWQYMKDPTYRRPDIEHKVPGLHNNGPEGGFYRQTRAVRQKKGSADAWQTGPPTMFRYGEEYLGESSLMNFRTVDPKALGMVDERTLPTILLDVKRGQVVKECTGLIQQRTDRETAREFELTRLQSFVDGKSTASHFYKWCLKHFGGEFVLGLMPRLLTVMPSPEAQKALLSANDLLGDSSERDAKWRDALVKTGKGVGVSVDQKFRAHRPKHVGADGNRISMVEQVPVDQTNMKKLLPAVQIREGGAGASRGAGAASNYKVPTRMRMSKQYQSRELFKKLRIAGEQSRTGAPIASGGTDGSLFSGALVNLRAGNIMLTVLKLHNQQLGAQHMLVLGDAIANNGKSTLTELDLSHNPLLNKGAIALGSILPQSPTVKRLALVECGIGCAGAVKLLTGHQGVVSHLTHLNLTGNHVNGMEPSLTAFPVDPSEDGCLLGRSYADGMKAVAHALYEHPNLQALSLAANGIAAIDVNLLCAGIVQPERTAALESVDLNSNPFGDDGAVAIALALRSSSDRLHTLALAQAGMGARGVKALVTSARANRTLRTMVVTLPGTGTISSATGTGRKAGGAGRHSRSGEKLIAELQLVLQANRHRVKARALGKTTTRRSHCMTSVDPYLQSQVRRIELGKHVPKAFDDLVEDQLLGYQMKEATGRLELAQQQVRGETAERGLVRCLCEGLSESADNSRLCAGGTAPAQPSHVRMHLIPSPHPPPLPIRVSAPPSKLLPLIFVSLCR
jgi:hypothetical protein